MRFSFTTYPAILLARPNRYRIIACLCHNNAEIHAHCPDPGRLYELLLPGVTVHVSQARQNERKTAYDLRFVEHPKSGQLISLDTRLPNQLFAERLAQEFFAPFQGWQTLQREVVLPPTSSALPAAITSRIDFRLLDAEQRPCWVEVKSVMLVIANCAYFPDAPTLRGRRHVAELAHRVQLGERTAVVFIIQRPDADQFCPNWTTAPKFSQTLVTTHAYTCELSTTKVQLARSIAVGLEVQRSPISNKLQTFQALQ
jgi:sugar fermentation stimulation protein A